MIDLPDLHQELGREARLHLSLLNGKWPGADIDGPSCLHWAVSLCKRVS